MLATLVVAPRSEASSILFNTTDLGSSYSLRADANGSTYGVSNSSGTMVYAFDKLPVASIDVRTDDPESTGRYVVQTLQVGSHQAGFVYDDLPTVAGYSPASEGISSGWIMKNTYTGYPSPFFQSPVLDVNAQGQIVGRSEFTQGAGTYAAFTGIDGQPHGSSSPIDDNLNNYINAIPGVTLTSAVKIDDLGRIIAQGSDGQDYLLTPTALGAVETVPEPSALAMFGLIGAISGWRASRLRRSASPIRTVSERPESLQ